MESLRKKRVAYCYLRILDGSPSIEKEIGTAELAKLSGDASGGTINYTALSEIIPAASAIVDGYCAKYYDVPFTVAPKLIEQLTISITIYKLYENKKAAASPAIRQRYDDAVALLRDIAANKLSLGTSTIGQTAKVRPATAFQANDRLFKRTYDE
jgi:phage gp36-like protein